MKEILEQYFAEQIQKDPAFAEKFDEKKIGACVSYVTERARKHLQGKNGAVEGTTVFKWARDFFNDGEAEKAGKDAPKAQAPETPAEPKVKSWEEAKAELEARKHKTKKKSAPVEENGPKQLLFDFGED